MNTSNDCKPTDTTHVEYNYSGSTTVTYSTYAFTPMNIDHVLDILYRLAEIDMIRTGWHNPIKVPIQSKPIVRDIKKVIRNKLPIKFRKIE